MTLLEMSACYAETAAVLSGILRELRARLLVCTDEDERFRLRRRIALFSEVLTQARDLAQLTAHYYERGYWRNEKYTL